MLFINWCLQSKMKSLNQSPHLRGVHSIRLSDQVELGSALEGHISSPLHSWSLTLSSFVYNWKFKYCSQKSTPSFWSSFHIRRYTRMENQEVQKSSLSVDEFNDMKSHLKNLTWLPRWWGGLKASRSPSCERLRLQPNIPQNETHVIQNKYMTAPLLKSTS